MALSIMEEMGIQHKCSFNHYTKIDDWFGRMGGPKMLTDPHWSINVSINQNLSKALNLGFWCKLIQW